MMILSLHNPKQIFDLWWMKKLNKNPGARVYSRQLRLGEQSKQMSWRSARGHVLLVPLVGLQQSPGLMPLREGK